MKATIAIGVPGCHRERRGWALDTKPFSSGVLKDCVFILPQPSLMHPYSPQDLFLPQYVPNDIAPVRLYATFGCLLVVIVGSHWVLFLKRLSVLDKGIVSWFLVCQSTFCI